MKKNIKKIILSIIILFGFFTLTYAKVPSFDNNFAKYLTDESPDTYGRTETVFNICIDRNISFMDNMKRLFYPNYINVDGGNCPSSRGGLLRDLVRVIGFSIIFVYLVISGISVLINPEDEEKHKAFTKNLMFILYGAFLMLGATWIMGTVLNIENLKGTTDLVQKLQGGPSSLFYQILGFLKAAAFFLALVMFVYYGYSVMQAMDSEDKTKIAQKGILHVLLALVLIKVIDYVFYIAQLPEFISKATDLIIEIAKLIGYLLGAFFVVYTFYAGFLLLTGSGDEESFKKAKNILIGIILASVVIALFLLIIYQIFSEFT